MNYKKWADSNPLKKWLAINPTVTYTMVAVKVGVSYNVVQRWRQGHSAPNEENMLALADMMNIGVAELQKAWDEWIAAGRDIVI